MAMIIHSSTKNEECGGVVLIYVSFDAKMATMGEIATQRSIITVYHHTFATTTYKELLPCSLKDLFAPSKIGTRLSVCNYKK